MRPLEAALHNICIDFWHNSHGFDKNGDIELSITKSQHWQTISLLPVSISEVEGSIKFFTLLLEMGPILAPLFFAKLAT